VTSRGYAGGKVDDERAVIAVDGLLMPAEASQQETEVDQRAVFRIHREGFPVRRLRAKEVVFGVEQRPAVDQGDRGRNWTCRVHGGPFRRSIR
jgi:hypothetical protein